MIAAVIIGLPLGQVLRHFFRARSEYCDVITLGVATWTAAILSLYYARIKSKSITKLGQIPGLGKSSREGSSEGVYHAYSNPGKDPLLSQDEMRILYQNLRALREEERYEVDPQTHPGLEIKSVILHALGDFRGNRSPLSKFASEAFPEAEDLLESAAFAFERGAVIIDCVPVSAMSDSFADVKAISYACDGSLRIVIGCEMMNVQEQQSSISNFCQR